MQKARKQKGVKRRSICVAEVKLWNNSDISLKSAAVLNKECFPNVFLRLTGAGRGALIEILGLTCVSVSLATHSYTDCGVYAVFVNVQLVNKRSNLKVRV